MMMWSTALRRGSSSRTGSAALSSIATRLGGGSGLPSLLSLQQRNRTTRTAWSGGRAALLVVGSGGARAYSQGRASRWHGRSGSAPTASSKSSRTPLFARTAVRPVHHKRHKPFYINYNEVIPVRGPGTEGRHHTAVMSGLVGVNALVFLMWQTYDPQFMLRNWTVNWYHLKQGRLWDLVTPSFSHFDAAHFMGNMLSLVLFGHKTYKALGLRPFLGLYLIGGIGCSLGHLLFSMLGFKSGELRPLPDPQLLHEMEEQMPENLVKVQHELLYNPVYRKDPPALGASGSVMAIAVACARLFPQDRIYFRGFFMPIPFVVGLFFLQDLLGLTNPADTVGHAGHLGGAITGLLYLNSLMRGGRVSAIRSIHKRFLQQR